MNTSISNTNLAGVSTSVAVAEARMPVRFVLVPTHAHHVNTLAKGYKGVNRNRKSVRAKGKKMQAVMTKAFKKLRSRVLSAYEETYKVSSTSVIDSILSKIMLNDWAVELSADIEPYIAAVVVDGGKTTLDAMGLFDTEVLALLRVDAISFARERSAELVGMRWVDGELVPNPNAKWAITDSTREMLRTNISTALESGSAPAELANVIRDSYSMSPERAKMIARTEMANADVQGSMQAYRANGVTGKRWLTAGDDLVSEECLESEAQGVIGIDEVFVPNGLDAPPNHPNCRCDVIPVYDNQQEE